MVGIFATIFTLVFGSLVGIIAGYVGGWLDSVLGRTSEIFLGIPLLLGGILFLYVFPSDPLTTPFSVQVAKVALVIGVLGWPVIMRLMRSSVLQVKPNDYVQAARALGASPGPDHPLPHPAQLAGLGDRGVHHQPGRLHLRRGHSVVPRHRTAAAGHLLGHRRSPRRPASGLIRAAPHMLIFPSIFLSLTVLAFIMLGDMVRDALDPKLR